MQKIVNIKTPFILTTDDKKKHSYHAGPHLLSSVPEEHREHWYFKAHLLPEEQTEVLSSGAIETKEPLPVEKLDELEPAVVKRGPSPQEIIAKRTMQKK